jgi:phosphoribosylglycinamide formyltransferase-1
MKKLAILVSGRGSNMSAIIDACEQGCISASVEIVLSNNADAKALSIAKEKRINTVYISSQTHTNPEQLDAVMRNTLLKHNIDLIILAGFMKKIGPKVLSEFEGKILNIHPSLLPKYGGKGFYGMNIHRAVVDAGDKESGATIHLVCGDYDDGKILAQETVTLNEEDTPESLAKKILKIEHGLYVKTIQEIIEERIIL